MDSSSKQPQKEVSADALAKAVGESYNTIDHWTGANVLRPRRVGRRRLYELEDSLRRCKRTRELQQEGHSLATIRMMLESSG